MIFDVLIMHVLIGINTPLRQHPRIDVRFELQTPTPLKQHPRNDISFELQTPTSANINSPSVEKLLLNVTMQDSFTLAHPSLFQNQCFQAFVCHVIYSQTLCLFVCTMTMFEIVYVLPLFKTSLIAQESIQVSYSWEHDLLNSNVVLSKFFKKMAYFNVKCHGCVYIMNIHKYVKEHFYRRIMFTTFPMTPQDFQILTMFPKLFLYCSKVLITCEPCNMHGFHHLCT